MRPVWDSCICLRPQPIVDNWWDMKRSNGKRGYGKRDGKRDGRRGYGRRQGTDLSGNRRFDDYGNFGGGRMM